MSARIRGQEVILKLTIDGEPGEGSWGKVKDWLPGGGLPKDETLATDLTSVEYGFRPDDSILLESKESMKKRGLASPDDGDALALTFAHPTPEFRPEAPPQGVQSGGPRREHDPYAALA